MHFTFSGNTGRTFFVNCYISIITSATNSYCSININSNCTIREYAALCNHNAISINLKQTIGSFNFAISTNCSNGIFVIMCTSIYTCFIHVGGVQTNSNACCTNNYLLLCAFIYNNFTINFSFACSCGNVLSFGFQFSQISTSESTIKRICNLPISSIFCICICNAITFKSGRFICFISKQTVKSITFVYSKLFNFSFSVNIRKTSIYFGVKSIEALSKVGFVISYSTFQIFNFSFICTNATINSIKCIFSIGFNSCQSDSFTITNKSKIICSYLTCSYRACFINCKFAACCAQRTANFYRALESSFVIACTHVLSFGIQISQSVSS